MVLPSSNHSLQHLGLAPDKYEPWSATFTKSKSLRGVWPRYNILNGTLRVKRKLSWSLGLGASGIDVEVGLGWTLSLETPGILDGVINRLWLTKH